MSLTGPEIDVILEELPLTDSHIQKVIQRDFRNLFLQIYTPPEAWWLHICMEHPGVRLHRTSWPPRARRSHQRFEDFLHARVNGGRIVAVEHVHHDRIVMMEVLRDGVTTRFYVRLWGTRANVILTDEEHVILDACFRKPAEGIESGGHFDPQPPTRAPGVWEVRAYDTSQSFNEAVDDLYHTEEQERERSRIRSRITSLLERARRRLAARLAEIENGQQRISISGQNRLYGNLILTSLHQLSPGAEWLDATDYEHENRIVRIPLNPRLSGSENAQEYFRKAQRAEESESFLESSAQSLQNRILEIDRIFGTLEERTLPELRELLVQQEQTRRERTHDSDTPGIEFTSGGFRIIVGRNAKENDQLLRGRVKGNDWWLHTRDYPGGYVFIRHQAGRSVPLEVLLDAGNLALFYSKGRDNGKGDLYYTQVKYLRRPKDGPTGLVLPTQEKNLYVELEQQRLERLGIGNSI